MKTLTPNDIKLGMQVQHSLIDEVLLVVPDENGPGYTGKEFARNEIPLSWALIEANNGFLELLTT